MYLSLKISTLNELPKVKKKKKKGEKKTTFLVHQFTWRKTQKTMCLSHGSAWESKVSHEGVAGSVTVPPPQTQQ